MVAIYVLKLKSGKYYVGMTRKNIQRVLDHIDGKGASWTKKYPPSDSKPIISFQENMKESDENRVTLETMAKYGVRNVRGGDWCKVRMTQREITQLEKKISNISKSPRKKSPSKKTSTYTRKTKGKKTKAKNPRCKAKTVYGHGPRCKLTASQGSEYCRVHAPYYPKKRRRRRTAN